MADEFFFQFRITGPTGDPWLVQLPVAPLNIGRQAGAEIVLDHPDVEPYHALVNPTAGKCQIMDLHSATGTFLGGQRLTPSAIVDVLPGATVAVGPFQLTCEQVPGPAPEKVVVQGGPARTPPPPAPAPAQPVQASPTAQVASAVSVLDRLADAPTSKGANGNEHPEPAAPPLVTPPVQQQTPAPGPAAESDEVDASSPLFRKKALEKLQSPEQLNELMTVTAPQGWLVLTALLTLLVGAALWAFVGVIETTVSGRGMLVASGQPEQLEAVLYLSPADAARLRPGMLARVSPVTVRKEEHGMLVGEVTEVRATPSSITEIERTLGNDALAQSLIASGALVEVRVALTRDDDTATGYRWTSTAGPTIPLRGGTVATGAVVISQDRPIALVFSGER